MVPKTQLLRIKRTQNVDTVAELYAELKKYAPKCVLQVPSDLDDYRMGGNPDFLKLGRRGFNIT